LYWDEVYKGTPPWDVGHPQPVFEALVKKWRNHAWKSSGYTR